jgi:hypothetical protein
VEEERVTIMQCKSVAHEQNTNHHILTFFLAVLGKTKGLGEVVCAVLLAEFAFVVVGKDIVAVAVAVAAAAAAAAAADIVVVAAADIVVELVVNLGTVGMQNSQEAERHQLVAAGEGVQAL